MIWRAKPQAAESEKPKGFDDFDLRLGDMMRGERATMGKSLLDVQRDLKIKATYIAAIENADISVFESPGFVAGYVRSYARYLNMDPVECFRRFCAEANFTPANGSTALSPGGPAPRMARKPLEKGADPLSNINTAFIPKGESFFSRIQPGAIASLGVLAALIGAIGYGGWSILQEVQRVQLAPVEQVPSVVVQVDPLQEVSSPAQIGIASGADAMERLYRPQALDFPVMTSRNGPIGSIDPRLTNTPQVNSPLDYAQTGPQLPEEVVQVTEVKEGVEILAVSPAWVRVSSADGTVLFEKILDSCERYAVPAHENPAQLRTGNAGGVYFVVNGVAHGPAGSGGGVVKNVALSAEALTDRFVLADLSADPDLAKLMTASSEANDVIGLPAKCAVSG